MKSTIFTLGLIIFSLCGMVMNGHAATFTALQSGAWNAKATWYPAGTDTTTTPANTPLPAYADDVTIPTGDSIHVVGSSTYYCHSLTVGGTFYMNTTFYVNDSIVVNSGGVFNMNSTLYCGSIYNAGKFWNPATGYSGSPKTLYLGVGFTYNGTSYAKVYGAGSYVIVNDGIFGSSRAAALASKGGSGIYVYFNNLADSITIRPSSSSVTGNVFTVGALAPYATGQTSTQNLTLTIKESIALLRYSTVLCFSLQNGDAFSGTRTCNIMAGDTVFVGGYFHTKTSAPSVSQGNMTYNVFGSLDFVTCLPTHAVVSMYTTTYAGNTSAVTLNVGDGTSANGGTLALGVGPGSGVSSIYLVKALSGQTLAINPAAYSTVTFGYSTAPSFTFTTAGVVDSTLIPSSFYNLTINNAGGVTIPTSSAINVSNALTLTAGKLTLKSHGLTASSISGGSSSSYVVTSGAGTLGLSSISSAATLPIGPSATDYAPVTVTPSSATSFAASVSTTHAETAPFGDGLNAEEWTLTPGSASAIASIGLTPMTATYTSNPTVFYNNSGAYTALPTTLSGNTYTATSLPSSFATTFTTGGLSPSTGISLANSDNALIYSDKDMLYIKNGNTGDKVGVYTVGGIQIASAIITDTTTSINLQPGLYLVKVGGKVTKVIIK